MASGVFQRAIVNAFKGLIDVDTDTYKVMLVTSAYAPDFDTDEFRSDVTNEVVGTGYTAGGEASAITVTDDAANDRVDYDWADVDWLVATITARGAVIYKDTGNAATDILMAYVDFGSDKATIAGTFTFTTTSPLRFQR